MDVISALEHALSQTHEPRLREQLTNTIRTLQKRRRGEERRLPARNGTRRPSQPIAAARKAKSPRK